MREEVEKAIEKIDTFLFLLLKRQFPGGVKIQNARQSWRNNKMSFEFTIKKGVFLRVNITGRIDVTNSEVVLNSTIPGLITSFVPEKKIKTSLTEQDLGMLVGQGVRDKKLLSSINNSLKKWELTGVMEMD